MVGRRAALPRIDATGNNNLSGQTPEPSAYIQEAAESLSSPPSQVATSEMSKGDSLSDSLGVGAHNNLPAPVPPPPPAVGAATVPPPPLSVGGTTVPPPPPAVGSATVPPPPLSVGATTVPSPPPAAGATTVPPPPPRVGAMTVPPPPGEMELSQNKVPQPPPLPKRRPIRGGTHAPQIDAESNSCQLSVGDRMTAAYIGQWSLPKNDIARAAEEVGFIIRKLTSAELSLSIDESKLLESYTALLNRATRNQGQDEEFKVKLLKVFFDCGWSGFLANYLKMMCDADVSDVLFIKKAADNLCSALTIMEHPIYTLPPEAAATIFDCYFTTIFDGLCNPGMMKIAGGSLENPMYYVLCSLISTLRNFMLVKLVRDEKLSEDDKVKVKSRLTEYAAVLKEGNDESFACYAALDFLEEDKSPFPQFSVNYFHSARRTDDNIERCVEDIEYVVKRLASVSVEDHMAHPGRYQWDFSFILSLFSAKNQLSAESKSRLLVTLLKDGLWHKTITDLYNAAFCEKNNINMYTSRTGALLTNIDTGLKSVVIETSVCEDPKLLQQSFDHFGDFVIEHLNSKFASAITKSAGAAESPIAYITRSMLSIVRNFAYFYEPSVSVLREKGMMAVARIFREMCQDPRVRTCCLLIIAYLMNESDDKKMMRIDDRDLSYLLGELHKSMSSIRRSAYQPEELIDGLNRIAVSDINKLKLMECGVLELLAKSLNPTKTFSPAHRTAAIKTIWNLAFSEEIRKEIKEHKFLMSALRCSKDSEHKEIRAAAAGALWQLEGKDKHVADAASSLVAKEDGKRHIMLSYNHQAKEEVHRMKDILRQVGYKVWIDTEQIATGASTLEAMSNAIEDSCLVLIFFSEPYKNSVNCRAEAEYVFERQKPFIPIQVQPGYKPDGWLGILFGSKYRYTLSKPDKYESEVSGLLGKVKDLTSGQSAANRVSSAPHVSTAAPDFTSPSVNHNAKLECESWSCEQIQEWVKESGLDKYMESLCRIDGWMLAELVQLSCDHKEAFYTVVSKTPHIDMVDILVFSKAVQALANK